MSGSKADLVFASSNPSIWPSRSASDSETPRRSHESRYLRLRMMKNVIKKVITATPTAVPMIEPAAAPFESPLCVVGAEVA